MVNEDYSVLGILRGFAVICGQTGEEGYLSFCVKCNWGLRTSSKFCKNICRHLECLITEKRRRQRASTGATVTMKENNRVLIN